MKVHSSCVSWTVAVAVVLSAGLAWGADQDAEFDAAIKALIVASQDADVEVRAAVLTVLARQPRSDAISAAFRSRLQDDDKNVRQLALASLVELEGGTDQVLRLLVDGLNDPVTVSIARESLVGLGVVAVPSLLAAMEDEATKRQAIQLLGQTKVGEHRARVLTGLTAALKDDSNVIRLEATRSLGNILKTRHRAQEIDPRYMKYFEQVFEKFDTNADGVLTEDEWTAMSKNPKVADADGDGRVTVEEYAQWALARQ